MTVKDVQDRIKKIAAMAGDDEMAHSEEDRLHRDVLKAISTRKADDPAGVAREALKTQKIDFARWCA